MLMLMTFAVAYGQEGEVFVMKGRVTGKGRPVPYATLQIQGTSVGVSCNDAGEYELRLPRGREQDSVIVRSMGYSTRKMSVARLLENGNISLTSQAIELKTVEVTDFSNVRHLLLAVVERIAQNYHQRTTLSTFFYRDWRAIDGELYLFDEAVMNVKRCPYSQYADKRGYLLDPTQHEMESNIKSILRHRLVVYDRHLLESKIIKSRGCDQMLAYSDNEDFFDPIATPQASYALASRMLKNHVFEPIRTFSADGEIYYLVSSVGPCRTSKTRVRYEYTIRKSDLALVRLVSSKQTSRQRASNDPWVNWYFNTMVVEADSSLWTYDIREGRYTLTRYYNGKSFRLESRERKWSDKSQHWLQCHDWVLTDLSLNTSDTSNQQQPLTPQPSILPTLFGGSDYNSDFWGHFNTIPLDSIPLQLLKKKYNLP